MKGRQQIALFAAVYFVPEGQHDSNQARSAGHEVPGVMRKIFPSQRDG
jgi:hypothetical protein